MSDTQKAVPGATLTLSEETRQALRDTWRAAGGVTYSAPSGQMAAMAEPKLFAFLAQYLQQADSTALDRGAPAATELSLRLDLVETELFHLVNAICPGLDSGDLIVDARVARAAMASTGPAAFFGIDDEPLDDGSPRYLQIARGEETEDDVPLYRRAATVDELKGALQAHADAHQLKARPQETSAPAPQAAPKSAAAKKAAPK